MARSTRRSGPMSGFNVNPKLGIIHSPGFRSIILLCEAPAKNPPRLLGPPRTQAKSSEEASYRRDRKPPMHADGTDKNPHWRASAVSNSMDPGCGRVFHLPVPL